MSESVLLVTGTSSGIGLATAVAAARAGFRVVATLRDPGRAAALREAAEAAGVEVDIEPLDVTDPRSVEACFDRIRSAYGRLDALVNNAGAGHLGTVELESVEAVRAVMEVNFFGVVAVTKAAMPLLRESRGTEPDSARLTDLLMTELDLLLRRAAAAEPPSAAERVVAQAERLIEERFTTGVRISDVAHEVGLAERRRVLDED